MTVETPEQHEALMQALMSAEHWPQGGADRRRIDTHISTVILAGDTAYKIKKPLDLGFLDFLSLESRRKACLEELRLNGRLAPSVYQTVCAITGPIESPRIDGDGEVIDWAVQMRRFDPDAILSNPATPLTAQIIDALADRVAEFHRTAAVCDPDEAFGSPDAAFGPMLQNFKQIIAFGAADEQRLAGLNEWTTIQRDTLTPLLQQRKRDGHTRECHGDLHLGNVALIDGQPVVFDAIEFNAGLRWIDTINDLAFMTMDLQERGETAFKYRLLDRYLQHTGDYAALKLLGFYEVYRAMVRAKIAAIRLQQPLNDVEHSEVMATFNRYVALAETLTQEGSGALVIMMGVSGSGKSYAAQHLADGLPAVRVRSDVERKRLLGVDARQDATALGAYSADLTERTYDCLRSRAREIIDAGYVAIADATFLQREKRAPFQALAKELGVPYVIVDCDAPVEVLQQRIVARQDDAANVSDADLQVLEKQLAAREPLTEQEHPFSIAVRPDRPLPREALRQMLIG